MQHSARLAACRRCDVKMRANRLRSNRFFGCKRDLNAFLIHQSNFVNYIFPSSGVQPYSISIHFDGVRPASAIVWPFGNDSGGSMCGQRRKTARIEIKSTTSYSYYKSITQSRCYVILSMPFITRSIVPCRDKTKMSAECRLRGTMPKARLPCYVQFMIKWIEQCNSYW